LVVSNKNILQFPIILVCRSRELSRIDISYSCGHLSAGQARNLAQVLRMAASTVVHQPDRLVRDLDLLPDEQRRQIQSWNMAPSGYEPACIHDKFREWASKHPAKIAVDAWDGQLTYAELDEASSSLAARLQALQLGKGDSVLVCAEQSKLVPVAWMAIFKIGAVLVPVDMQQPVARLKQIAAASRAAAVISTAQNIDVAQQLSGKVCTVGGAEELRNGIASAPPFAALAVEPDDIAYIMFTSGSTGTPKGITVPHSAFCSMAKKLTLSFHAERLLQFASYSFTPAVYEILLGLCAFGGRVCIPSAHDRVNNLEGFINDSGVDWAMLVPSVLRPLNPENLKTLKTIVLVGEPMKRSEARRWPLTTRILYAYASSENAVVSFNDRVDKLTDMRNVGYSGGTCWVVDPANHNRLQPIGVVGEAVVYSPGTASSYVNDPQKSKQTFFQAASWVETPSKGFRFCRTGDLMYHNSDGSLSFSGRNDLMVKIRGQRVELPEVERSIAAGERVRQAVVTIPRAGKCADRLTAVVTLNDADSWAREAVSSGVLSFFPSELASDITQSLNRSLLCSLPEYMVPAAWVIVEALPLTASGKLDRMAVNNWLRCITPEAYEKLFPTALNDLEMPTSDLEQQLQSAWAQALKMEPKSIGRTSTFIDLGGDSISAMTVIALCREKGISLNVRDVVRRGTIAELAKVATHLEVQPADPGPTSAADDAAAEELTTSGENYSVAPMDEDKNGQMVAKIVPCSPMQESLLLSKARSGGHYECSFTFKITLDAGIDSANVARAWQTVVNRHSILRTIFVASQLRLGSMDQAVLRHHQADVSIFNFQHLPVDPLTILEAHRPVVKEGRPPHAMTVCQVAETEAFFKLDLSHLLFDGFSIAVLVADLRAAMCGMLPAGIAPDFADYVEFATRQDSNQALAFWKRHLLELEPCSLPMLVERPKDLGDRGSASQLLEIRKTLLGGNAVDSFARSQGVNVSAVLQLAWALVLRALLNRDDVAFGMLTSGRDAPLRGIEAMAGPLINILTCRCNLTEASSLRDVLRKIQDNYLDALPHQYVPLGQVQHALGFSHGLFTTAMSILKSPDDSHPGRPDWPSVEMLRQYQPTEFDIVLNFTLSKNEIELDFNCWSSKISSSHANSIVETYLQAVESIVGCVTDRLCDVEILASPDRRQIQAWSEETMEPPIEATMHGMISQQSKRHPRKKAVDAWDGAFDYGEVEQLTDTLARCLLDAYPNLPKGSFVPVCFEKSRWTVIAMLAVMKSGWAYVPFDPSHPRDRLQGLVAQSSAKVVIVSSATRHLCDDLGADVFLLRPEDLCAQATGHGENRMDDGKPLPVVSPEDDAYVLFTSGSTGLPKGVVVQHFAYCSSAVRHAKVLKWKPTSRVLQFAAHVFDGSVSEIFTTLIIGACICIPSDTDRMERLAPAMHDFGVTWAFMTPTMARTMGPEQIPSLETLVSGGEALTPDVINIWASAVQLIHVYGTAETAVYCSAYRCRLEDLELDTISVGRVFGCAGFVTEPNNPNKLVPIGGVGELLLTGPLLSRGYLNSESTARSYVRGLAWSEDSERRFYRTGDLVRWYADGTISFSGRKDYSQVKLRGQRIELGEIEYAIPGTSGVFLPREGPFKDSIVAVISVNSDLSSVPGEAKEPTIIKDLHADASRERIQKLQAEAAQHLAPYMLPSAWIVVEQLPAMISGKLNRRLLNQWLTSMSFETYVSITQADNSFRTDQVSEQEAVLLDLVSVVLNKPREVLNLALSFIGVGGDSITAMQLTARCLLGGYRLKVRDVLQARSLSSLASKLNPARHPLSHEVGEVCDVPFDLGPVQAMHFKLAAQGVQHYNQSYLLRVDRRFPPEAIEEALASLVRQHGMLRARFQQSQGRWKQIVRSDADGSLLFETCNTANMEGVLEIAKSRQKLTNFMTGPVLVASLISTPEGDFLSLVGHHLVVDLVSWRILLGSLEDLLLSREPPPCSLPFKSWVAMQQKRISELPAVQDFDHHPETHYAYWAMDGRPNLFADVECMTTRLPREATSALLSLGSGEIGIEPSVVMMAALLHSFSVVFPDRQVPSVFSEHHGREAGWDTSVDISRTVGWFTTISSITTALPPNSSMLDILKRVKDAKKSLADNGWQDFASKHLRDDADTVAAARCDMELVFNFFGLHQQFERADAIFKPIYRADEAVVNWDGAAPRMALFEIAALIQEDELMMLTSFNRNMARTDDIRRWILASKESLEAMIRELRSVRSLLVPADVPLSKLDQPGLEALVQQVAADGTDPNSIQDLYPCTPIQQGILLSQAQDPAHYVTQFVLKISDTTNQEIGVDRMKSAWSRVVRRHPILRTRFVLGLDDQPIHQLVLREWDPIVAVLPPGDADPVARLRAWDGDAFDSFNAPHAVALLPTTNDLYFCLRINHAIWDAHSLELVSRELMALYEGALEGGEDDVPVYADYVAFLQGLDLQSNLKYWKICLEDVLPCHFPSLRYGYEGESVNKTIHIDLTDLQQQAAVLCATNNITLSNVVQVAWAILLGSYTGSDAVCFGYLTSGRDIELRSGSDPHQICGPLINSLVSRYQLDREQPIKVLLKQARENYINDLPHEHCSLIDIQHELALSGTALFNTTVSFAKTNPARDRESKLSMETVSIYDPTEYVCSLNVQARDDALVMAFNYQSGSFDDSMATFAAQTLKTIFEAILANPDQKLGNLGLICDSGLAQIQKWNSSPPPAVDRCLHHIFEDAVRAQPSAPAVHAWDIDLTYEQLDELASKVARELRLRGIEPDMFVPLCFDRSGWYVVAVFAILKAGAAFVPLDPSHPTDRHLGIIRDVGAAMVLVSEAHVDRYTSAVNTVLILNEKTTHAMGQAPPASMLGDSGVGPHSPAIVFFTSGTTGTPKGIVLEHRAVASSARSHGETMLMGKDTRAFHFAAPVFDAAVAEILTTLMRHGTVCVPSEFERMNDLPAALKKYGANWAFMTPSLASMLSPRDLEGLKLIAVGGEMLRKETISTLASSTRRLQNIYGPTECCVMMMCNDNISLDTDPANIGHPRGALVWLVDPHDHNRLAPVGSVGEILIEGPLMARGYLNYPEGTAAAFVTDPAFARSGGKSGRRMYLTGDLARYNADGSVNFIRRKDNQIKLRGNRIELGEVESQMAAHSAVRLALALMPQGGHLAGGVVAVLCLATLEHAKAGSGGALELLDLRQHKSAQADLQAVRSLIANQLPPYMMPSAWLVVKAIPLNTSMKMDRKKVNAWLESLDPSQLELVYNVDGASEEETSVPSTSMEQNLQSVWKLVLNAQRIPLSRSFMSLGGDSLTAMQVVSQSRKLGVSVTVKDVLQCRSLSELASKATYLKTQRKVTEERVDVAFDLSPIQRTFFNLMPEGTQRFNQSFAVKLNRHVTHDQLRRGIEMIVQRHSMLRARFVRSGSTWKQRIGSFVGKSASYELSTKQLARDEGPRAVMDHILSSTTFEITKGPLFAAHLIEKTEDASGGAAADQWLLLISHHLVVDLVSWRTILWELEEMLHVRGDANFKEEPLSFQAWCEMQAEYAAAHHDPSTSLAQTVPEPDYAFWGMEGVPNVLADVESASFTLDRETSAALLDDAIAGAFDTEPVDLLIAAVVHSFHLAFDARNCPAIFSEGHGRESWDPEIDIASTVGWFTTMAPLYCGDYLGDVRGAIMRVKDVRRRTPGGGWPFFCSQHLHEKGREAFSRHARPEITFNYTGRYQQLERSGALFSRFDALDIDSEALNYSPDYVRTALVDIVVTASSNSVQFNFVYNKRMKHQSHIRAWVKECKSALEHMVELLPPLPKQLTLADMPLMPLDWDVLADVRSELHLLGIHDADAVEEIYPLSKLQQGMVFSQERGDHVYEFHRVVEFTSTQPGRRVDSAKLLAAWEAVVRRHPILRTIFFGTGANSGFYQATLKSVKANVRLMDCSHRDEALKMLETSDSFEFPPESPPHRLIVCTTDEAETFVRLEMDHKIIDGYSMGVIIQELLLAYDERLDGSTAAPLYRDYIQFIQGQSGRDQVSHWKEYLRDVEPCYFPTLLDGKPDPTARGQHSFEVDLGICFTELQGFCNENDVTLFSLLQTSWAIVLRAFTGSNRVCFGYLSAGRDAPVQGIDALVGPVLNMMTCHLNLEGCSSARSVLQQTQSDFLSNLEFQHVSLADVHHALGLSGDALFNTILSLQKAKKTAVSGGSIQYADLSGKDPTEYVVTMDVLVSDDAAGVEMSFEASQISPGMAENIAATFAQTVRAIVRDGSTPVDELDMVSPRNLADMTRWNGDEIEVVDARVDEVISALVRTSPQKEAVVGWDGSFTYRELEDAADRVAQRLREMGVKAETMVPFCFDKSVWAVVAMLAILKAGGAFVPLDPEYPQERLESIVRDTGAKVVVSSPKQEALARKLADRVVVLSSAVLELLPPVRHSAANAPRSATTDAAYVIFTSGSTGQPKGIVIEHRAIATSSRAHGRAMHVDSSTRSLQFASYTFDVSVEEIFTTLQAGGTVCVPSSQERLDDINGAIARYGATWADLTPTVAALITPAAVPSFKTLCLGGEPVRQDVVDTWLGKVEVLNGYGPAEASVTCACSVEDLSGSIQSQNIGKGAGCHLWVVDPKDHNRLAPVGTIGELLIEGPVLAREYLKDPVKTAAAFVTNPAWAPAGRSMRLYKTQDLVRYTSKGTLDFIGRSDTQVKIRGQRVELGDIEFNLSSYPGFDKIIVLFPSEGLLSKQLTAVVTMATPAVAANGEGERPLSLVHPVPPKTITMAMDWLATRVPAYMVPHSWAVVNSMPLLASGKIARTQIVAWANGIQESLHRAIMSQGDHETGDASRATAAERQIQELCAQVLNKTPDEMLLSRSFMNLGGDSITAMRLTSQARAIGLVIPVQAILRSKSLSAMAAAATPAQMTQQENVEEQTDVAFALSPIQKLHFDLYPEGENHYNQSFALCANKPLESDKIAEALRAIVCRHSMLRARFEQSEDGSWQQRISSGTDGSFQYETYHVDSLADAAPPARCLEEGLDIRHGPVFRAAWFNIPDHDPVLFLVAHHLVVDLVSWRILIDELESSLVLRTASIQPSPSLPFQAWCSKLQAHVDSVMPSPRPAAFPALPDDNMRYWGLDLDQNTFENGSTAGFNLPPDLTSRLLSTSNNAFSTEAEDILLSCLAFSFRQAFPDRQLPVIFSEGHGREAISAGADPSGTVGWFTILKPFFVDIDVDAGVVQALIRTKDARRAMAPHQLSHFDAALKSRLKRNPVVEMVFNFHGQFQQLENSDALFRPLQHDGQQWTDVNLRAKRDSVLDIEASITRGQLGIQLTFSKHTAHGQRIQDLVRLYRECLVDTITTLQSCPPRRTVSDFDLLKFNQTTFECLLGSSLPAVGLSDLANVEDIYPCSSMQEGMLLSQGRSSDFYQFQLICELRWRPTDEIDIPRLAEAWRRLVEHHATLRSIVVEGSDGENAFYQVVLGKVDPEVQVLACRHDDPAFSSPSEISLKTQTPPHRLRVCRTPDDRVFVNVEMNHVFTDGASMSILLEDLVLAYDGKLAAVRPLYRDYVSFLDETDHARNLVYWKEYLQNSTPTCLTGSTANSAIRSLNTTAVDIGVELDLLKTFCSEHSTTIASLLQLAWALVLRVYTNSEDVCFGYLSSGRDVPVANASRIVGPLINILTCRLALDDVVTAIEALRRVQDDYIKTIPHQHVSLAAVQHAVGMKLNGTALFNTVMSVQRRSPVDKGINQPLDIVPVSGSDPNEFDCTVGVDISDATVSVSLTHWTDKITPLDAEHIGSTYAQIVRSIIEQPSVPIGKLQMVSPLHSQKLMAWNAHPMDPLECCVHTAFERHVNRAPDRNAIHAPDRCYTYGQLNAVSQKIARLLRDEYMVGPETLVPFCFSKSSWTAVAMTAILKAGGACVPMEQAHPRQRKEHILRDIGAIFVITSAEHAPLFDGLVRTLVLDQALVDRLPDATGVICKSVRPSNAAFLVFTSGSTGKPKGIVLEHRNITTSCTQHGKVMGYSAEARVLNFAAPTFDVSLQDHWTTLLHGGCICVPTESERLDDIESSIRRTKANLAFLTPTVAGLVDPDRVPSLKTLILGGEAVTKHNLEQWADRLNLIICWGPAECTVYSSYNGPVPRRQNPSEIGRPIPMANRIWVTKPDDPHFLVPVGCIGEACVEGPIVARGYLNDPSKTEASFVDNPAYLSNSTADGKPRRIYRTGDLVRYGDAGTVFFVGRKDNQVKLNGQRLELEEVEHHLRVHDSVKRVVVYMPPAGPARKKLVAVLEPLGSDSDASVPALQLLSTEQGVASSCDVVTLRNHLSALVPGYMTPSIWAVVSKMPLGPTGKLHRKEVARWLTELSDADYQAIVAQAQAQCEEDVKPANHTEGVIQAAVATVLGLAPHRVSLGRSFLSLGGDSISAMQVMSRCRAGGVSCNVRGILQRKRLRDIADLGTPKNRIASVKVDEGGLFPITPVQHLFMEKIAHNRFLQEEAFEIHSSFSASEVKKALRRLVETHAMLRARVLGDQQRVVPASDSCFHFGELTAQRVSETEAQLEQMRNLISFRDGPVFAAMVLRMDKSHDVLYMAAHHAVIDEVSWSVIRDDLESLLLKGSVSADATLPMQAWAALQRDYALRNLAPPRTKRAAARSHQPRGYWGEDFQNTVQDVSVRSFRLDTKTTSSLMNGCNVPLSTTPLEIMLASVVQSFRDIFSDRPAPIIFTEGHGREPWEGSLDVSRTVGWFTTM